MRRRVKPGRSTLIFFICVLAVPTMACMLYGTPKNANLQTFAPLLATGTLLGLGHLLLRPLLRLITAPLGCLTFGLSGTAIDIGLIYLSAHYVRGFHVPEFLFALLTALLINAMAAVSGARK